MKMNIFEAMSILHCCTKNRKQRMQQEGITGGPQLMWLPIMRLIELDSA